MHEKVLELIYEAIDELNETEPEDRWLAKDRATPLYGDQSLLDSLGLIKLIVAVEGRVAEAFDVPVTIANEKALSQRNSPFKSVNTLADYVVQLLEEQHV